MKYIIANWKANKNLQETKDWLDIFLERYKPNPEVKVIICPPYPLIYYIQQILNNQSKNITIGSQDISSFEKGSYTGEIPASVLEGLVEYVIIGHSERRKYFNETDEILFKKANIALNKKLKPIYCIRDIKDKIPPNIECLAYEPVYSIGSGRNEDVNTVLKIKNSIQLGNQTKFIYGGSVTEKNAYEYWQTNEIDGLLVGSSSLDPEKFSSLVIDAASQENY